MPPWTPAMPWPSGTPGGASSPHWGGYVRLWVRANIASGHAFHMGAHPNDRLDAGNVLGGASAGRTGAERLWIDVSCDVVDLEIAGGATSSQGILSKADAATFVATLADPDGIYDPLNPASPWSYGGRSRLVPGTPIEAFAEVVNGADGTWTRHWLFTGTADSWSEAWTPQPSKRQAKVTATDATKRWNRYNRPEQPPVGAGDTTAQRVQRLVDYFDWPGTIDAAPASSVTLQATTLASPGWEMLNRTIDDELGFVHFTPDGTLRWTNRDQWQATGAPVLELGCGAGLHDVLVAAQPASIDAQMRNAIYVSRTGGTSQAAISTSSQDRYGEYDYKRTDLGLETDAQAGIWASTLLLIYAYPQTALENVTLRPAIEPQSWALWEKVLALELVTDLVRILWAPPDHPEHAIDVTSRVVGTKHKITRRAWETTWQLIATNPLASSGAVFTMGVHPQDRLDAGFVLGYAH